MNLSSCHVPRARAHCYCCLRRSCCSDFVERQRLQQLLPELERADELGDLDAVGGGPAVDGAMRVRIGTDVDARRHAAKAAFSGPLTPVESDNGPKSKNKN